MNVPKCISALVLGATFFSVPLQAGLMPIMEIVRQVKNESGLKAQIYNQHPGVEVLVEFGIASWYDCPTKPESVQNQTYRVRDRIYPVAHKTLPFGTLIKVINPVNGKKILARVIDRGPFIAGRIIDLDRPASQALGIGGIGKIILKIYKVDLKQMVQARKNSGWL